MHDKNIKILTDEFYMRRCIQLALLGRGYVAPNPMVGAVLVHQERIIGEGYHQEYGKPHAEVNCINSVAEADKVLVPDSTLYVSLEPCAHFGKTPPCADLIIREGIKKVIIGCIDTTPKVNGKGVQKLKDAGIEVQIGILEKECRDLNKRFFVFNAMKRPYIILKWAQSANNKIGTEERRITISNQYTNILVHKWRSEESAIMVGNHTAQSDNPTLTNRFWSGKSPLRIVLAGNRPSAVLKMYVQPGETIVFNTQSNSQEGSVRYVSVDPSNYLNEVLMHLYQNKIQSVLVEGGAQTHQQFFDSGHWDECRIITSKQMIIPVGIEAPKVPEMTLIKEEWLMQDFIQYYTNDAAIKLPE